MVEKISNDYFDTHLAASVLHTQPWDIGKVEVSIKGEMYTVNSMENTVPRSAISDAQDFDSTKASQFRTSFKALFDQFFEADDVEKISWLSVAQNVKPAVEREEAQEEEEAEPEEATAQPPLSDTTPVLSVGQLPTPGQSPRTLPNALRLRDRVPALPAP